MAGQTPRRMMLRYRLGVASRAVAAVVGGYALAALSAAMLARLLPMSRSEAATAATMIALLMLPAAAIWVFAARTATRAWVGLFALAAPAALIAWLIGQPR